MNEKGSRIDDVATSPEDRARLLSADAVSLRSTSSSPALTFFRNRIFSFASGNNVDERPVSSSDASYTVLDEALSDSSTILGAPRRTRSAAQLHSRHHHNNTNTYGALTSSTSLSSCASQMPAKQELESPDPRLYSEHRKDRFKAKATYYLKYYLPILTWLPKYPIKTVLASDILAGLTIASFNMPLSLSYARTLCHVPEEYGLLGFAFPQLVYAFMGTVPVMVVGPEPGASVMVGQAITPLIYRGDPSFEEVERRAIIYVTLITFIHALMYLIMGFFHLGFLDALLSAGLLRGFIASTGLVLTMDTIIPGFGLAQMAAEAGASTGSVAVKVGFFLSHLNRTHGLTAGIFLISFGIVIGMRQIRSKYVKKHQWLAFVPEILAVIIFSIVISAQQRWDLKGVDIVGEVNRPSVQMKAPINSETFDMFREILPSALIIGLIGYFQSAVIAKSIFPDPPANPNLPPPVAPTISSNRELVALGTANFLGMFMSALPVIGGYGRSRANVMSGARTLMSAIVFSLFTIIVTFGLLPLIYYLPRAVLSAVLGIICVALLEDLPGDIKFYIKMRAWKDMFMVALVMAITIGVSLQTGVTVGIALSLLQILAHATKSRIQVLARVPGTSNVFRDADKPSHDVSDISILEHVPGVLLVRIAEPLMFANTSELEARLHRLERYGSMKMHPSLPATRSGEQNIIIDLDGMTACDLSAVKVLTTIVRTYREKGKYVLFAHVTGDHHVRILFKRAGINKLLSYNGHPPAFFEGISEALEALDECIFETPGDWTEEDDVIEPEPEEEYNEEDLIESVCELETEVGSENEKLV
ncbi:sulfate transporter family-domain-containing protein [Lipomyces arxii]|uniref:sulfate transporter family-domain-containing protein n=1 Tax=Lipomyces arxii TaxID=56418 RepID=UPI0034CE77AB